MNSLSGSESAQKKRKLTPKQMARLKAQEQAAKIKAEKDLQDDFAARFKGMPSDMQAKVLSKVNPETHKAFHAANKHFRNVTNKIYREPLKSLDKELHKHIPEYGESGDAYYELYRLVSNLYEAQGNSGDKGFKNWSGNNRGLPYRWDGNNGSDDSDGEYDYRPPRDAPDNIKRFFSGNGRRKYAEMEKLLQETAYFVAQKKGIPIMQYPAPVAPQTGKGQRGAHSRPYNDTAAGLADRPLSDPSSPAKPLPRAFIFGCNSVDSD